MKKYRLLFDTPWNKKGEIFEEDVLLKGLSVTSDHGSDWFEEVKPGRWEPGWKGGYWYVGHNNEPALGNRNVGSYWRRFECGNCFPNKYQAEEAAKLIKKALLAYQEELLNGEV